MTDEWTVVLVTYDELEADMLKAILESGDIPVQLRSAKVGPYPVNIGRMGEVKVLVRESDRENAEEVIRKFREEPQEPGAGP
ncbi:MAG: DUF2007 domain-containing protein [Nitrospirae bacterium]|nr:DUF2007 domain-containing protein [Nitrospirota bacterium]